jgi:hypothetical protein
VPGLVLDADDELRDGVQGLLIVAVRRRDADPHQWFSAVGKSDRLDLRSAEIHTNPHAHNLSQASVAR